MRYATVSRFPFRFVALFLAFVAPLGCSSDDDPEPQGSAGADAGVDVTTDGGTEKDATIDGGADSADAEPPKDSGADGKTDASTPSSDGPGLLPNFELWEPPVGAVHIDPTNDNDPAEDGSEEHPYDSFEDITWTDDTVYVIRRGTTLETDVVGIGANGVTLASYGTGDRPVVHCTAVAQSGSNRHAISLADRTNVTIRDIEVYAPEATSCLRFGGENSEAIEVINCVLHGAGWGLRSFSFAGLHVLNTEVYDIKDDGIFIQNMNDIEIEHCYVHDVNQNWTPPYTPQGEAGGDGIQFDGCNRWHVHHNEIDRTNSGNKFCFISNNADQDDGVVEHNLMRGPLTDGDGGASIYFHNGDGLIVRYNMIEGPSPGPLYSHASNLHIYGNVFMNMDGGLHASTSAEVLHNVFYGMPLAMSGGALVARNNIFALGDAQSSPFGSTSSLEESHNLFADGNPTANSIGGSPAFVDAAQGDFHLLSTSDAIDQGMDTSVTTDMDGVAIPQGSAPDIGAFEYVSPN